MSVYTVKVYKDGRFVREWQVECSAGGDPDCVLVDENGNEQAIVWTEAEVSAWFEEDLSALLDRAAPS